MKLIRELLEAISLSRNTWRGQIISPDKWYVFGEMGDIFYEKDSEKDAHRVAFIFRDDADYFLPPTETLRSNEEVDEYLDYENELFTAGLLIIKGSAFLYALKKYPEKIDRGGFEPTRSRLDVVQMIIHELNGRLDLSDLYDGDDDDEKERLQKLTGKPIFNFKEVGNSYFAKYEAETVDRAERFFEQIRRIFQSPYMHLRPRYEGKKGGVFRWIGTFRETETEYLFANQRLPVYCVLEHFDKVTTLCIYPQGSLPHAIQRLLKSK